MGRLTVDDGEEELSGSENDDNLEEDMEALRRACILTRTNPSDLNPSSSAAAADVSDSDSEIDDLELVRSIRQKFPFSSGIYLDEPLSLKPLCARAPGMSDDDEDDFETLRAIQRRFSAYDASSSSTEHPLQKPEQVRASSISLEKETSNNLFVNKTNACEGFPDFDDTCITSPSLELSSANVPIVQTPDQIEWSANVPIVQTPDQIEWHESSAHQLSLLPIQSSFPKSAQLFIDAIKKNRSCQKLIRSKLILIEARIEENKKLKERFKILKDFQAYCRRRTGMALSQKKDPRTQLISAPNGAPKDSKVNGRKVFGMSYGPAENSHVANYKMALTKFPLLLYRQKWSNTEREDLKKGVKQEFQKALLEKSVDLFSPDSENSGDIDCIIASIKDLEITPENFRLYLPKIDWKNFASIYVKGRSGAECEARWLNHEDPLINSNPWTKEEDKNLLLNVQERGLNNWIDVAVSLGTNRTPFQCLARFQRSLNGSILKKEWTKDEDAQLSAAVEAFGEGDWQLIASTLEGRAGVQCSNRWRKSLNPARQRVGRWTSDEDKRLKVAVMLFGPKTWQKIAQFVPGRTQVQCRERWANCLDPSLNWGEWTEDEDRRLLQALEEHNYCWSKVAACVPRRTDSQCRRRWIVLCPDEVPKLQAARKIQKAALISNFVDRELERPNLGPEDFVPLPLMISTTANEEVNASKKRKRKSRRKSEENGTALCCTRGEIRSMRSRKEAQIAPEKVRGMDSPADFETFGTCARDQSCLDPSSLTITEVVDAIDWQEPADTRLVSRFTEPVDCQSHLMLPSQSLVPQMAFSDGVEAFGGSYAKRMALKHQDTASKKSPKPCPKRTKCTEPAGSPTLQPRPTQTLESGIIKDGVESFSGNSAASIEKKITNKQRTNKEKQLPKPHSKGNKCTKPAENLNALKLSSLDLDTFIVHDLGPSDGSNTITSEKERAPKCRSKSVGAEESTEHLSFPLSSGKSLVSGTAVGTTHSSICPIPALLMITDAKERTLTSPSSNGIPSKKRTPKQQHKMAKHADLSEKPQHFAPIYLDERKNAGNRDEICSEQILGNGTVSKKRTPKRQHNMANRAELSEKPQHFAPVYLDEQKNARNRDEFCSKQILGNGTVSKKRTPKQLHKMAKRADLSEKSQHFAPVCLEIPQHFAPICLDERKNARGKCCSKQILGNIDEDDIPLASMFKKRSASVFGREDKRKELMIRDESCYEQNLEKRDEDDIPLACMFKKNRRDGHPS